MSVSTHFRNLLVVSAAALLTACASVPKLGEAPQVKPATVYGAGETFQAPDTLWPIDRWWIAYGDKGLDALMDEAISGSPDLVQAQARVRQADALARQAGAARMPGLAIDASVTAVKQSYNNGFPAAFVPQGWNDAARAGFSFSWDFDLMGKNRALLAAATSNAQAAEADAAQARLVLSTAVAAGWADLARLNADRAAAEQAVRVRADSLKLMSGRQAQGLENTGAVKRAEAGLAGAKAELAAVDEAIGLTRNRLAALAGKGPDRGLALVPSKVEVRAFGLPQNLQADLIGRRPDVVAARLRAEAASKRIKAAKADFYPNVKLNGFLGLQVLGLDFLTRSGSTAGDIGPAIRLPIFDGGRIAGAYRGSRAEYDAAVASYDATLVRALNEVADAAVSGRALDERLTFGRQALAASQDAYRVAQDRYRVGLSTYLDVLVAEDALIASRRSLADLESRAFVLDVALVRALGGGFQS
jgi:NodT family efflux transporter outer membrane factor (OMF) lipoprotein